jgi:ABC-type Zn uptake system ZnuABC Zn-binding protein ZnuA
VLAVETFLAEIAQNVAGERVIVESLIPLGLDPHAFEPTPQDVRKIAESDVLIVNGAGFEAWLAKTLENAGGQRPVIEASAGLASRAAREGESVELGTEEPGGHHHDEGDPHFWLDPTLVVKYVENIRDGLIAADPDGREVYIQNAADYIVKLNELDGWIQAQVAQIPVERRLIVTNHESFGYFADRYGFKIIGTIVPSVTTGASPSAQQLARLVDQIRATGVSVIFLETGASPQLAEQVSAETGIKVVPDLYSHSITDAGGNAPTYIEMMKHNVNVIVAALK